MGHVRLLILSAGLALGLLVSSASAGPIDFMFGYNLNATTDKGMTFTGTFAYDPATNKFLNTVQHWVFQLQKAQPGVTTGDLGTATFTNPGINNLTAIAWPDANVNFTDYNLATQSEPSLTYIDIVQSAGTGLLGWGSSLVDSHLSLEITGLPMSYSDPAGLVSFSDFDQWAPGQTENCPTCFTDGLTGTITLQPDQNIPAPVTTPEPASWLLLVSGLALLGAAWRRGGARTSVL